MKSSERSGSRAVRRVARRRSTMMVGLALASSTLLVAAGTSLASGATVGDPQPELAPFSLGYAGTTSSGTGTVLSNGDAVLASMNNNGTSITVCVIKPGGRLCSSKATLHSFTDDDLYGSAVVATSGADVSVVSEDSGSGSGTDFPIIVYDSVNGGKTFAAPVVVSTLYGVNSATLASGQVVIAVNDVHSGLLVQTIDPTGVNVQSDFATLSGSSTYLYGATVTSYNGGVLVASDNSIDTKVWYAPYGSNFSDSGSYSVVGSFAHELVAGLSGNALLTTPSNSISTAGILSLFNGSSFGPEHKVPDSKAGDDGYFTLATTGPPVVEPSHDNSGDYHVFFEGRRDGYDMIEESTTNGVKWSAQTLYGSAVASDNPVPVLATDGAGIVFESDSTHQLAQPILNTQSVRIAPSPAKVKPGVRDEIKGTVLPRISGHSVELEVENKGAWYNVTSTHETAAGAFAFSVPGKVATYRAVVSLDPGYFEFGYSNSVTVSVIPPR